MKKHFFIKTFGCQMNDYESLRVCKLLEENGYVAASTYDEASVIILNTCTVRQKAEDKIYSELGRIKKFKIKHPDIMIGIGGCLAQQEGEKLLKKFPYVDFVFGTKALPRLLQLIHNAGKGTRIADIAMETACQFYAEHHYKPQPGQISAYVTVMQGCDNFCSYCIVPYVRGREWSRPVDEICNEVQCLVNGGVCEITLLGQNVNSYGKQIIPKTTFTELLKQLDEIKGLERIRFTTSHPKDLSPELIHCFGYIQKLCEHIHLPMQSGSDRILQHMNRQYTRQTYLEKISRLRSVSPHISITSDIIVGYPGETDAEFEETASLIGEIKFDDLFIFHYTDRQGTKASEMPDTIPYPVKIDRLKRLNDLQRAISLNKNRAYTGTVVEVLFEEQSKKGTGCIAGRTRSGKVVNCTGPEMMIGKKGMVLIEKANIHSLTGKLFKEGQT
jgi:tRNA-2-methylthio-N6-dimethylallyladenosine synthase